MSPKKLLESKWTAVVPVDRDKHFVVIQILGRDEAEPQLVLEALLSKRKRVVARRELEDVEAWKPGWL